MPRLIRATERSSTLSHFFALQGLGPLISSWSGFLALLFHPLLSHPTRRFLQPIDMTFDMEIA
ncbi:hypothetical protein BJX63DRAFT_336436 [Aspergillus granulosus]|uniref:Uncharacterized protein n=1 Tax=Aspergillus granulosus TaxID=176169 RepID=A0ABR4HX29_9EURO